MPRQMKPRQPVTVGAAFVSQLTSLQVLGIDARRFLEALVPRCKGAVVVLGQLRLVPLDVAVEALRGMAERPEAAPDALPETDDQPQSVDEVLRRLGHERIPA